VPGQLLDFNAYLAIAWMGFAFMAVELHRRGAVGVIMESAISSSDIDVALGQLAKNYNYFGRKPAKDSCSPPCSWFSGWL